MAAPGEDRPETLGDRVRRLRTERGMSLAKVAGGDFSRAFLNQVELNRSRPSVRVLRGSPLHLSCSAIRVSSPYCSRQQAKWAGFHGPSATKAAGWISADIDFFRNRTG